MADFIEYENENRLRSYPFSESSSFVSTSGFTLDISAVLDAIIYPYKPVGPVRLTRIDYVNKQVTISDDVKTVATGYFGSDDKKIDLSYVFYKSGSIEIVKPAGSLYISETFFNGTGVQDFTSLYFSASCSYPITPHGVEGIIIDGKFLTGIVHFTTGPLSEDSPYGHFDVWSFFYPGFDDKYRLGISIKPKREEVKFVSTIKNIVVRVEAGSPFVVDEFVDGIQVSLGDVSREDICAGNPEGRAQDYYSGIYDKCKPTPAPGPVPRPPINPEAKNISFNLSRSKGRFLMLAPDFHTTRPRGASTQDSDSEYEQTRSIINPISITPSSGSSINPPLNFTPEMSQGQKESALLNTLNGGDSGNAITIQVPGLL